MRTSRVFVLTIHLAERSYESQRTIAHLILRRRADYPLLVRDNEAPGKAQRSNDWNKLRYTSGRPYVQAVFLDEAVIKRVKEELRTYGLPTGVVSYERRRNCRAELPCTCVLLEPREVTAEGAPRMSLPFYGRVTTCPRHARLVPRSGIRPLVALDQQQVGRLLDDAPFTARSAVPVMIDEPASPPGRSGQSGNVDVEALFATVARRGTKIAMYG